MDRNCFTCPRCGYTSKHKHNLIRHLNRKSPCLPITSNIDNQDHSDNEKNISKLDIGVFQCKFNCGKTYAHISSVYAHQKKCVANVGGINDTTGEKRNTHKTTILSEMKDIEARVCDMFDRMVVMTQSIVEYQSVKKAQRTHVNKVSRNVNDFESEQLDYVVQNHDLLLDCLEKQSLCPLVKDIYFHKDHDENHKIRIIKRDEIYKNVLWFYLQPVPTQYW